MRRALGLARVEMSAHLCVEALGLARVGTSAQAHVDSVCS